MAAVRILITGCSGGGKSTLLDALERRGEAVVPEPGRRIVAGELAGDGAALPWVDGTAFARRALAMALADLAAMAGREGRVFFDRGAIDAATALEHLTRVPVAEVLGARRHYDRVFLAPPWPEIYVGDAGRRHGFDAAVAEYSRIEAVLPRLGYAVTVLPRAAVEERVAFVLANLHQSTRSS